MALNKGIMVLVAILFFLMFAALNAKADDLRGTGDLGLVIEREAGKVAIIDTTEQTVLGEVDGLGDLSHASAVFDRSGRFAFVFGRDGGLTKVDLLERTIARRIVQAGNSIGGAISQDSELVAVSNYEPGGVKVFSSADLELVLDIPATYGDDGAASKVVGLVDAPDQQFLFSLYDAGEIWRADMSNPDDPIISKYHEVGDQPYDGLITPDGRHYLAGLFGEDGISLLDLWNEDKGPTRILDGYGKGEEPLPVYKMPHLEGWAAAGDYLFLPAVGRHELLVVDSRTFEEKGRIEVHGQPIFAVARPDGRQIWVNFAHPDNDTIQVIDVPSLAVVKSFQPGRAALHMEFTPRGEAVWISVRDEDRVDVYDTASFERLATLAIDKPSGIFFTARANRIGL